MLNINRVMLTGRLTREPETKYLSTGMALTNISIAVSRNFKDKNGEWREDTAFIDVEVWGKAAERVAETARKGQPVYVEGRLKQDTWERDGVKQSKIRVNADVVKPFDVPQRGQGGPGSSDEGSSYGGGQGGGYASQGGGSAPRPQQQQQPQQQSQSSAADGLHFDDNSPVNDDVPF